jgi:hypothetical protein
VVEKMYEFWGVKKSTSVPYFPQGNGIVERSNRTLQDVIAKALEGTNGELWDEKLPAAVFAYNTIPHVGTGASPFELFFGRLPRLPSAFMHEVDTAIPTEERYRVLKSIYESTAEHLQELKRDQRFRKGDDVLVYRPAVAPGWPKKFSMPWKGPYQVTGTKGYMRYIIRGEGDKEMVVHTSQMKPYFSKPEVKDHQQLLQQNTAAAPGDITPTFHPTDRALQNPPANSGEAEEAPIRVRLGTERNYFRPRVWRPQRFQ